MTMLLHHDLAEVTYRATRADQTEVALRLCLAPEAATVTDAWTRLRVLHDDVDPRTLEIEVRKMACS
jgi:hypothetical protein